MSSLYDYIFKRKSTRKYIMSPLEQDVLDNILSASNRLVPIYTGIETKIVATTDAKNLLPIKAPHYLAFYSEKSEGYLENAGFMLQQLDLYLSSLGLGSCWLGMANPVLKDDNSLEFIIILAFGKGVDSPYRELSEFKRKPLSEISQGFDTRLEAARLAPSATNSQNWFFICENEHIHIYRKKLGILKAAMYDKMNQIDMGIALAHLHFATAHEKKPYIFTTNIPHPQQQGYTYVGTVL